MESARAGVGRSRVKAALSHGPVLCCSVTIDEFDRLSTESSFVSREVIPRGRTVYAESGYIDDEKDGERDESRTG